MKKQNNSICPIGSHYVRSHKRKTKNGLTVVAAHCRQNLMGKEKFLFPSNLDYIFEKNNNKYTYKKLQKIKGYSQDKGQYDQLIQFWLKHWKEQKLTKDEVDPLLVKAIIAAESSFRESVITDIEGSTATGLMQITKTTMKILAQKLGKEVKKSIIEISQKEAKVPNINIAAGTRWLIYKITTSPWRKKASKKDRLYGGIKYYHS